MYSYLTEGEFIREVNICYELFHFKITLIIVVVCFVARMSRGRAPLMKKTRQAQHLNWSVTTRLVLLTSALELVLTF
jgi:hypothetical protein